MLDNKDNNDTKLNTATDPLRLRKPFLQVELSDLFNGGFHNKPVYGASMQSELPGNTSRRSSRSKKYAQIDQALERLEKIHVDQRP